MASTSSATLLLMVEICFKMKLTASVLKGSVREHLCHLCQLAFYYFSEYLGNQLVIKGSLVIYLLLRGYARQVAHHSRKIWWNSLSLVVCVRESLGEYGEWVRETRVPQWLLFEGIAFTILRASPVPPLEMSFPFWQYHWLQVSC